MSNAIANKQLESPESENSALATVTDLATNLITGTLIPDPIKRNAFKAFSQLCAATLDIPIAYLEGVSAEIRAETEARSKLISTGADRISDQMDVGPEYAHAAVKKFAQKVVRERINLDKACEIAAHQIQQDSINYNTKQNLSADAASTKNEISDDWLNNFEREASLKSTEEMQLLFGRILAGEIQRPSSFSIKTVKMLGEIDNNTAILFQRLCSICISIKSQNTVSDARVLSLGGKAGSNALKDYGLAFAELNLLEEHGLIIPDYNSWKNYSYYVVMQRQDVRKNTFTYQNKEWRFTSVTTRPKSKELHLHGVALSRSGRELLSIVDINPNKKYTSALLKYFESLNLCMIPATKA